MNPLRLAILALTLKALDLSTTFFALKTAGIVEFNPVMRWALESLGPLAYAANFLVFGAAVWFLYRKQSKITLIIIDLLMLGVVINNLIVGLRMLNG